MKLPHEKNGKKLRKSFTKSCGKNKIPSKITKTCGKLNKFCWHISQKT